MLSETNNWCCRFEAVSWWSCRWRNIAELISYGVTYSSHYTRWCTRLMIWMNFSFFVWTVVGFACHWFFGRYLLDELLIDGVKRGPVITSRLCYFICLLINAVLLLLSKYIIKVVIHQLLSLYLLPSMITLGVFQVGFRTFFAYFNQKQNYLLYVDINFTVKCCSTFLFINSDWVSGFWRSIHK